LLLLSNDIGSIIALLSDVKGTRLAEGHVRLDETAVSHRELRGLPKQSCRQLEERPASSTGRLKEPRQDTHRDYPRLEKNGLIASDSGMSDNNRRARYYRLTAAGRRALGDERESWARFATGLDAVLRAT